MKRALVLSGGGAKGAFELGALEYIQKEQPSYFDFQIVAGISVGSLNGVMIAQKKFPELQQIWTDISNDKVYTGSMPANFLQYLWLLIRIVFGRRSILGIEPLTRLLKKNACLSDVKTDYRCGFVSLVSGDYVPCKHSDFGNDDDNFRKAILASCTMPIIWTPVNEVKIGSASHKELVDGGVRNVSPLKDVLVDDPDEIVIINLSTKTTLNDDKAGNSIFRIFKRSLTEITINEIFREDIEEFVKTNSIVKQCAEKGVVVYRDDAHTQPYKYFNAIIIEPGNDLGDALDFSKERVEERRKLGYEAAKAAFEKYMKAAGPCTARSYK